MQKTVSDGADVTRRSRPFLVRAAAIGKARSTTVDSRVRRTSIDNVDADSRRDLIPWFAVWNSSSTTYVGAEAFESQNAASLY